MNVTMVTTTKYVLRNIRQALACPRGCAPKNALILTDHKQSKYGHHKSTKNTLLTDVRIVIVAA